jgi:hypothetical protein
VRTQILAIAAVVLSLAGCSFHSVSEPPPPPPRVVGSPQDDRACVALDLELLSGGVTWSRPPKSWADAAQLAALSSPLLHQSGGSGRRLWLQVDRTHSSNVASVIFHVLSLSLVPRVGTTTLSVSAQVRDGEHLVAESRAEASFEIWSSSLLLFWPPAWSLGGHRHDHPLALETLQALVTVVCAELSSAAAETPAPGEDEEGETRPSLPDAGSECETCEAALEPTWNVCPLCATPVE